jgi:hypothetical protein
MELDQDNEVKGKIFNGQFEIDNNDENFQFLLGFCHF